jgi:hypothetical protein
LTGVEIKSGKRSFECFDVLIEGRWIGNKYGAYNSRAPQ